MEMGNRSVLVRLICYVADAIIAMWMWYTIFCFYSEYIFSWSIIQTRIFSYIFNKEKCIMPHN